MSRCSLDEVRMTTGKRRVRSSDRRRLSAASPSLNGLRVLVLSRTLVYRYGISLCPQASSASDYAPRTFYPVRNVRVTVLYALAHPVGCVTTVGQGHDGEHEPKRDQHDGGYAQRHYREDYRNEGVNEKDNDPGYLVPERLQGVEAHLPRTVHV